MNFSHFVGLVGILVAKAQVGVLFLASLDRK